MAYKKRTTSEDVEKGKNRRAGILQFEPGFDYGNGLTEETYTKKIQLVEDLTKENNDLLTQVDGVSTALDLAEKDLATFSARLLSAVGSKYTFDSIEYEKAGGKRKSEIKRSRKGNNGKDEK